MNSNTFNIKRFGSYIASDARNCAANFGLSAVLISCAGVITYLAVTLFNLIFNGEWMSSGQALRLFVFCMAMIVMVTSMPVKCYGRLTEKRAGSSWLMIPDGKVRQHGNSQLYSDTSYHGNRVSSPGLDHLHGRPFMRKKPGIRPQGALVYGDGDKH